jgi:hypothetical protein
MAVIESSFGLPGKVVKLRIAIQNGEKVVKGIFRLYVK